jgi:hypothetical protein
LRAKRSTVFVLVGACLLVLGVGSSGALAAKKATTKVTIDTWAAGFLGVVGSSDPGRCAEGRRIVVFRQQGPKPDPGQDQRVGSDRASADPGGYRWTVEADHSGDFYAQATPKRGCGATLSATISGVKLGAAAESTRSYPACGPYVSEGPSPICRVENLRFRIAGAPSEGTCFWATPSVNCFGATRSGPFPWANNSNSEDGLSVQGVWAPSGAVRSVSFSTYQGDRGLAEPATLVGTLPDADSPRFTVTDAIAPGERPYAQSDHFYTPNLPGQGVGEVGGPLELKTERANLGNEIVINGYLYLKR